MKIEIWKTVLGYNGDYVVSNLGNVISFKYNKRRVLKPDSPRGCLLYTSPSPRDS